jgi:predicted anti-sigma-YlaC factor YlaD
MTCPDFENRMVDYLDGSLEAEEHRTFAEHAMQCPACRDTLADVKQAMLACRVAASPDPPTGLASRILARTATEEVMSCEQFEEYLTDCLDGFVPAPVYHRWEEHAAQCSRCTELPGDVVRAIGACYTYVSEEQPLPAGLNERILQATLGTAEPKEFRAPLTSRLASRLRLWLDPIVSPQLATVATMLLVAVFVLTNTVSADGSISGMYQASVRLAEQSYASGAYGLRELVRPSDKAAPVETVDHTRESPSPQPKRSPAPKDESKQPATEGTTR